jgi:protein gp37
VAENSRIEWTDHTFNPWTGCTRVSPGCDNCYAAALAKRAPATFGSWEPGGERKRTSESYWRQPFAWNRKAQREGKRARVFCASMADVFDNKVPRHWRDDLWQVIHETPHLDWLLLTKRPENIADRLPGPNTGTKSWGEGWPNVWLGTTVEDRERARRRLPVFGAIPAAVRFISAEPLVEDWSDMLPDALSRWRLDWIICGGESGGGAREMPAEWARHLRDATAAGGAAFFMKQMTRKAPIPADLLVRHFPVAPVAAAA